MTAAWLISRLQNKDFPIVFHSRLSFFPDLCSVFQRPEASPEETVSCIYEAGLRESRFLKQSGSLIFLPSIFLARFVILTEVYNFCVSYTYLNISIFRV